MHPVSASTSARVDRGVHRDPELVAAQLAVGLGVDDPVGAQGRRHRVGRDGVVEVDGADHQRTVSGFGDVRRGVRRPLRPPVERLGGGGGALDHRLEPALGVHPVQLLGHQEQGGHRRGVVGLVLGGVVDRQWAGRRTPGPNGRSPRSRPLAPARPATSARSTARRRRRRTSAGRSSRRRPGRGRPAAHQHRRWRRSARASRRRPPVAHRSHHGRRGLVVRPGVGVHALLGSRRRQPIRARSR